MWSLINVEKLNINYWDKIGQSYLTLTFSLIKTYFLPMLWERNHAYTILTL